MKFKKSLILTTVAVSSALFLTACNDKQSKPQAPAAQQQQQNAPTDKAQQESLNRFNSAVRIVPTERNIGKDKDGKDVVSFTYRVENLGDKPIKEIQWFSLAGVDMAIIDISNIPVIFEKPLEPKKTENVFLTKNIDMVSETSRPIFLDPKSNIEMKTLAGKLVFADGSEILVTSQEDLVEYLKKIAK
ncbi:hypothetical protein [Caviibacterium pharyngocola]|uniref:Lipoprotein n=1 Tax=Caviibacterium pharyngocola TaxID=28159 RepID=A0A2M8RUL6_9PAST|nr:hypothetical protein [Caviibacterium pharyngocola]PJG82588.1 hypothetical protein CVP04_08585 [Caviibacterium pharyngocola]